MEAGKEGKIYVVNRDQMTTGNSHYCDQCGNDPEIIEEAGVVGGMFNLPTYWNHTLYFWGTNDVLKSIPVTNGLPDFTHITGSTPLINFPGAGVSVSSNGTTAGSAIVWAIDSSQWGSPGRGPGPAVLYAYDATNIPTMLYSSGQDATRDAAGNAAKFAVPTVDDQRKCDDHNTDDNGWNLSCFPEGCRRICSRRNPSPPTVGVVDRCNRWVALPAASGSRDSSHETLLSSRPLALILLTGNILTGCALGVTSSPNTSSSRLTVTAVSGTQTFGITLTVTHR